MLREIFIKDFGWKLFSLLLAAFIWYTVHKIIEDPKAAVVSPDNVPVIYPNVPVVVVATAADAHIFGVDSNAVSVTVSGAKEVMDVLEANQIHAMVDVSGLDDNSKAVSRRVDVSVPWGVTVIDVEPAQVRVIPPKK
ncbi:MAG TPA: CdaR family protein [Verrucomicrobiae bacterium]|jgi:hypothetical protein|nr:CdaR family protein [Verrucomicrobiae bacterium]